MNRIKSLYAVTILALILSACGAGEPTLDAGAIATSAVQTAIADLTRSAPLPVASPNTPTPTQEVVNTPSASPTISSLPTYAPSTGGDISCVQAKYVEDVTVADGQVFAPGEVFTKQWRVQNIGTCAWDSNFSMVLASGDAIGAGVLQPFSRIVYPGETEVVSIVFTTPVDEGTYKGYWRIQTPYGVVGFGQYGGALYVEIESNDKPKFRVTHVNFNYTRNPISGCPNTVKYQITATITANMEGTVEYYWIFNNGEKGETQTIEFDEAGSETVKTTWGFQTGASNKERVASIFIVKPNNQEFGAASFSYECQ